MGFQGSLYLLGLFLQGPDFRLYCVEVFMIFLLQRSIGFRLILYCIKLPNEKLWFSHSIFLALGFRVLRVSYCRFSHYWPPFCWLWVATPRQRLIEYRKKLRTSNSILEILLSHSKIYLGVN